MLAFIQSCGLTGIEGFRVTVEVSLSPTFFAWVFQFGGMVLILGPDDTVKQFYSQLTTYQQ